MQDIEIVTIISLVISLGAIISVIRFICSEKKLKNISYADLFIEMINTLRYRKTTLPNDYPEYPGKLEDQDTEEYIIFLRSGILDVICSKGNV